VALRAERSGTTRHKARLGETRTPRPASRRPRWQWSEPLVVDPRSRTIPGPVRRSGPPRAHRLLPATRGQQRGLGQHRSRRLARL